MSKQYWPESRYITGLSVEYRLIQYWNERRLYVDLIQIWKLIICLYNTDLSIDYTSIEYWYERQLYVYIVLV